MNKYEELKEAASAAKDTWERTQTKADLITWRKLVNEYHEAHTEILVERGLLLKGHTHPELVDATLRSLLAREILILRKYMPGNSDYIKGVHMGLDTFARRIQEVNRKGLDAVYQAYDESLKRELQ